MIDNNLTKLSNALQTKLENAKEILV